MVSFGALDFRQLILGLTDLFAFFSWTFVAVVHDTSPKNSVYPGIFRLLMENRTLSSKFTFLPINTDKVILYGDTIEKIRPVSRGESSCCWDCISNTPTDPKIQCHFTLWFFVCEIVWWTARAVIKYKNKSLWNVFLYFSIVKFKSSLIITKSQSVTYSIWFPRQWSFCWWLRPTLVRLWYEIVCVRYLNRD